MRIYLCRWPNGDCSIVAARDRDSAIDLLDNEVGDAEGLPLHRLESDLLINLRLHDAGNLELDREQPMSSELHEEVIRRAYPILDDVLDRPDKQSGHKQIREAVKLERKRVRGTRVIAGTRAGRRIQKIAEVPASKSDRIVRQLLTRGPRPRE